MPEPSPVASPVTGMLLKGTTVLVAASMVERGLSFLASFAAARIAGPSVLGAYSLAITTANNIATYTGSGMGTTANRYSGQFPREHPGYGALVRSLILISSVSAAVALVLLLAGARPFARVVLHNEALTTLLQCAALSAAAMILFECCKGFLIGQRRFLALLLCSLVAGLGMAVMLPLASRVGARFMVLGQTAVLLAAVAVCFLFAARLGLSPLPVTRASFARGAGGPRLAEVWLFGLAQLGSIVSMNAAGWWLMSLVVRADPSMVQMGFFAVSHQVRNMAALAPALLTQSSYALLTDETAPPGSSPEQTTALCTYASLLGTFILAGPAIVILPWAFPLLYGKAYAAAVLPTALALLTAVVHMGGAPAAARLTIVSLRASTVVNGLWAVMVAVLATVYMVRGGGASEAALIYFAAHLLASLLFVLVLARMRRLPAGMLMVFFLGAAGACALAVASWLRVAYPEWQAGLTLVSAAIVAGVLLPLLSLGRRHGWTVGDLRLRRKQLLEVVRRWKLRLYAKAVSR